MSHVIQSQHEITLSCALKSSSVAFYRKHAKMSPIQSKLWLAVNFESTVHMDTKLNDPIMTCVWTSEEKLHFRVVCTHSTRSHSVALAFSSALHGRQFGIMIGINVWS